VGGAAKWVGSEATIVPVRNVAAFLDANHYLGAAHRGFAWSDEYGVIVLAPPTSRHLPTDWLELSRWCLVGGKNAGSQQWARVARYLRANHPATTVISYSDPSVGHTGALYRACNWIWAPTWHRLRTPPTAGGSWDGKITQAAKDRWVFPLKPDARREAILRVNDSALQRQGCPNYIEPAKFRRQHNLTAGSTS
jgi:hypothetical protein